MSGITGGYGMRCDVPGTSWQPESTPMGGVHGGLGGGSTMLHGSVSGALRPERVNMFETPVWGSLESPIGDP
jgi:hypothetical protein